MIIEDLLKYTRNHSSEVRALLLYIDTTLNAQAEGYVTGCTLDCMKDVLTDALEISKGKIDAMIVAIEDLE